MRKNNSFFYDSYGKLLKFKLKIDNKTKVIKYSDVNFT
jgi:hypothetical protein